MLDSSTTERRRSERVKREKPDYYDALEFENKRKATTTPTRLDESAYFYKQKLSFKNNVIEKITTRETTSVPTFTIPELN